MREGSLDSDGSYRKLGGARRECKSAGPTHHEDRELVQTKSFPGRKENILSPEFRLATMMGFVPSQMIVKAILTGKPHPIRMMYLQGGNPLLSYANAKETFEAIKNLNFLAVSEIFLTPTAQLADILLQRLPTLSLTTLDT